VLDPFFSILWKYDDKETHNMFSLMIDPRFKRFSLLILCYISHEDVAIVEEYDKISLYPMLLKCHNHLYHALIYKVDWHIQGLKKIAILILLNKLPTPTNQ
jgi:hypothetical protein